MNKNKPVSVLIALLLTMFITQQTKGSPDFSPYIDNDGDGYGVRVDSGPLDIRNLRQSSDPDDNNPEIHPAAKDSSVDGIDQNGDGIDGPAFDPYGGWLGIQREATGFFRVEKIDKRWWFITPEGHPFFMNSPSGTSATQRAGPDGQEYDPYAYAQATQGMGFNTVGMYDVKPLQPLSEAKWTRGYPDSMPYFVNIWPQHMTREGVADFFDPQWLEYQRQILIPKLEMHKDAPNVIGFSYGLEAHWFPDHKSQYHVFDDYMRKAENAPGKLALVEFMRDHYNDDIEQLNKHWKADLDNFEELTLLNWLGPESFFGIPQNSGGNTYDAEFLLKGIIKGLFFASWDKSKLLTAHQAALKEKFAGFAATQYYKSLQGILREHAPNHLIVGDQQVLMSGSKSVARAAAKYMDVYSVNPFPTNYWANLFAETLLLLCSGGYTDGLLSTGFGSDLVSDIQQVIGDKPMWVEFGIVGDNTEHNNDEPGNFAVHPDQENRTEFLESLYDLYLQSDQIVGIQYYAWADQPLDLEDAQIHENNQFGLNDRQGLPYELFSNRYKELNTWWLTRLQSSDQESPQVLKPVLISSGHSTGSVKRLNTVRSTSEWIVWATTAWRKQDLYSKVKSLEIQLNKMRALVFSGAESYKLAQQLYRWGGLHTVHDIDNIDKMLEVDPVVDVDSVSYEINIAPELDLVMTQVGEGITRVRAERGPVIFTANALDLNKGDVLGYTWTINGKTIENNQDILEVHPEQLHEGDNNVSVAARDDGSPLLSQSQERNFFLEPVDMPDHSYGGSIRGGIILLLLFGFYRRGIFQRLSYISPKVAAAFLSFWSYDQQDYLQDHYIAAWLKVVERFKGNPKVIGYDLMNEPYSGNPVTTVSRDFEPTHLKTMYDRLIPAIREIDDNKWIFYEPQAVGVAFGVSSRLPPIEDSRAGTKRLVYAPHAYPFTLHEGVSYNLTDKINMRNCNRNDKNDTWSYDWDSGSEVISIITSTTPEVHHFTIQPANQ